MFPTKPKHKRRIYLDHAATTPVDSAVRKAMEPYFCEHFGNPSGLCGMSREVNGALNDARRKVAGVLHTLPDSIVFTGGGSESDNLAIFGVARQHQKHGRHIITTKVEHHAVLNPFKQLSKEGFEVTFLGVDEYGRVTAEQIKKALRPETILVSVMYANNEIGTVEPIADIGRMILKWRKEKNTPYPYFHSDACQAAGALDLDVEKLHVDLMTLNGSKIYGPKGVGILFKRRDVEILPLIFGGEQEMRLRAGTENVPGIIGVAKALGLAQGRRDKEIIRLRGLVKYFWDSVQKEIPKVKLNGPEIGDNRLPNNLNFSILDIEGEALLLYLDEYGITCSTGSACTSQSLEPSHVLTACGLPYEYAHGSLRFTLGKETTKQDIDYVMKYLPGIAERLREISPVNLS
ncbi:MAG: cysteine desulfurase [Candidatus Magasanikbacteria bacterium]|nr:cysteine desulfurase [Candidatus Magasanikbacteria bacterium]